MEHFRKYPPTNFLIKRITCELVELRALLFNINRDPKKSQPLFAEQLAPDLFHQVDDSNDDQKQQEFVDRIGERLLQDFSGWR